MAKILCPGCGEPKEIASTGIFQDERARDQSQKRSSRWWVIIHHKHPEREGLCPGSGKRV